MEVKEVEIEQEESDETEVMDEESEAEKTNNKSASGSVSRSPRIISASDVIPGTLQNLKLFLRRAVNSVVERFVTKRIYVPTYIRNIRIK